MNNWINRWKKEWIDNDWMNESQERFLKLTVRSGANEWWMNELKKLKRERDR